VTAEDVVLITGCSTGIGRATARLLAREGYTVYATARRPDSIADLAADGCRLLPLDVTDEASAAAAVQAVEDAEGAVDVLVNNAGINEIGAMETVPLDLVRRIFETNVFGAIRMSQLVLPAMRRQRTGQIIFLGSMLGRFTFPGMGSYCATKHSLEAIADALRHEVRPFGVKVSVIEPGMVRTEFGNSAADRAANVAGDGAYDAYNAEIGEYTHSWKGSVSNKLACDADDVAEAIHKAIRSRRARYRVAASARLLMTTRKFLPDVAFDAFMRTQFPSPRPQPEPHS
jgi:NADP-dependent 3-hydroxy acid dehydrogenase YdfG